MSIHFIKNCSLLKKDSFSFLSYENSDVFFLKDKKFLSYKNISDLIILGLKNKRDLKICMHRNTKDELHNMVNFLYKKKRYYPHRHNREEIYHFIKGKLKIILLDRKLKIKKIIILDKKIPIVRIKKDEYHLTIPVEKFSIFHEIKRGPFLKKNTKYASKNYFVP